MKAALPDLPPIFWYKYEKELKKDDLIKGLLKTCDKLANLTYEEKKSILEYRNYNLLKRFSDSSSGPQG